MKGSANLNAVKNGETVKPEPFKADEKGSFGSCSSESGSIGTLKQDCKDEGELFKAVFTVLNQSMKCCGTESATGKLNDNNGLLDKKIRKARKNRISKRV